MMENWIIAPLPIILKTVVTCVLIFAAMVVITRISGLRTFAKMSSVDFATTIAVGSVLAAVIMNSDQSLLKGAIALGAIIGTQALFSILKRKSKVFDNVSTNEPILLMRGSQILDENLANARVSKSDLISKLRESNVRRFDEVLAVVFETTGDISVLHKSGDESIELENGILEGVRAEVGSSV